MMELGWSSGGKMSSVQRWKKNQYNNNSWAYIVQYHCHKGMSQSTLQHIITGTDLYTQEPTSTPRGVYKRAATRERCNLGNQQFFHCLCVRTHFKYCWVNRGNGGKVSFPRIHRATWLGLESTAFGPWARRSYPFDHAAPIYSLGKKRGRSPFFFIKRSPSS